MTLIGPFSQILTMDKLLTEGPLSDNELVVVSDGGILVENGVIAAVDSFHRLKARQNAIIPIEQPAVALPGLIDAHTHICFAGSRAADYALRVSGTSYQEIAAKGGGIMDTVNKTREASLEFLVEGMLGRLNALLSQGITTCEVKSGYGLSVEQELKLLRAVKCAASEHPVSILATCLAAHIPPKEFSSSAEYLREIIRTLFPLLKQECLTERVDIFIEKGAFHPEEGLSYLQEAKKYGFTVCVHANQFSHGGAEIAALAKAKSADHLEVLTKEECLVLKKQSVSAIVLPGASLGLGMPFAPSRMMLDEGLSVAIASDWNPGSAPMGKLVAQAAMIGAAEKMTLAETLSAITARAALSLGLGDRGILRRNLRADIAVFPCSDYREILYQQGSLLPSHVFIAGQQQKGPKQW